MSYRYIIPWQYMVASRHIAEFGEGLGEYKKRGQSLRDCPLFFFSSPAYLFLFATRFIFTLNKFDISLSLRVPIISEP